MDPVGLFSDACTAKLTCDVPLFPNMWNVWLVAVSMEDNPSADQIRKELRRLYGRNLTQQAGAHLSDWLPNSDATDLAIHTFLGHSEDPQNLTDMKALSKAEWELATKYLGSSSVVLAADLNQCATAPGTPPPGLRGKAYTLVLVQFVWRGNDLSTGWKGASRNAVPGWLPGAGIPLPFSACLNQADYLLTEVWKPLESKQVPATGSDSWLGNLSNEIDKIKKKVVDGATKTVIGIHVAMAAGAAVAVLGLFAYGKVASGGR